jgi:Bacterial SH3 domain
MGLPKKLSPDVMGLSGRYPAGVLENPEPIAQRFAHAADLERRPADPTRVSPSTAPAPPTWTVTELAMRLFVGRTRSLVAGFVLAPLGLAFILGGIWISSSGRTEPPPVAQAPDPQATAPSAVLTTSTRIEAKAGDTIGFPIALDGTDGVPSRSVIAITGLPQASNFSEGRPFGESEWILKPDQIGDLHLVLPAGAAGEFKLAIALIAPDDKVVAEAETLLAIAPAAAAPEPVVAEASDAAAAPSDGEATSSEVPPDVAIGGEAEPEATAETTETAIAPSADTPPQAGEQTREAAAASSGAQPNTLGQADTDESGLGTVQPSVYVNMREAPKSSSPVLGVIAKGVELVVLDRKRGWVQVTDPASGKKGWIYSGLLAGEAKTQRRVRRGAPAEADSNSAPESESFWGRVGRWLTPG